MPTFHFGNAISQHMTETEPEKFLVCFSVPIARIGHQNYTVAELRNAGASIPLTIPSSQVVDIYRSPEEVFSPATIASASDKPFYDEHTHTLVNAENYSTSNPKGHISNVHKGEGEWSETLVADVIVNDKKTINKILSKTNSKRDVSCGYSATYTFDATYTHGEQHDIRINHLALCVNGRAGKRVAIMDSMPDELNPDILQTDTDMLSPRRVRMPDNAQSTTLTPFQKFVRLLSFRQFTTDSDDGDTEAFAVDAADILSALAAKSATTDSTTTVTVDAVPNVVPVSDSTTKEETDLIPDDKTKTVTTDDDIGSDTDETLDAKPAECDTTVGADAGESNEGTVDSKPKTDAAEDKYADAKQDSGAAKQDEKDDAKMIQDALAPIMEAIKELKADVAALKSGEKGETTDCATTVAPVMDAMDEIVKALEGDADGGDCGGDGTSDSANAGDDGAASLTISPDKIGDAKDGKKKVTSDSNERLIEVINRVKPLIAACPDAALRKATTDSLINMLNPGSATDRAAVMTTLVQATQDSAQHVYETGDSRTPQPVDYKAREAMFAKLAAHNSKEK
jgi:hypothetical protein